MVLAFVLKLPPTLDTLTINFVRSKKNSFVHTERGAAKHTIEQKASYLIQRRGVSVESTHLV